MEQSRQRHMLDQAGRLLDIRHGQRMTDGLLKLPSCSIPGAGPLMQLWDDRRLHLLQAGAQHLGKEMMIAIPLTGVIQRDEEEIGLFELLQKLLAVLLTSDRITQRRAHLIKDRRLQQK